jgi:hypothetical protein
MIDVDFMNNVTIALSNEEMTKIKFIDLKKLYNFVVENFFIWINLLLQNVLWSSSLPSEKKHSAKCQKKTLGKEALWVFFWALSKELLCRVFFLPSARKKHSTNHLALGKEPVSDSVYFSINYLKIEKYKSTWRYHDTFSIIVKDLFLFIKISTSIV